MKVKPPIINPRRFNDVLNTLKDIIPFYTPEWTSVGDLKFGQALLKIFSHLTVDIVSHLNRAPEKHFVAFLKMLGIEQLPARPARVPVRFILSPGPESGILIPKDTQVAASAPEGEIPFETESDLQAVRSPLLDVVAVDPEKDEIYLPPPKFLQLEMPAAPMADYEIVSFVSADSDSFQLDRIDGLEENDQLKIIFNKQSANNRDELSENEQDVTFEYVTVRSKSGDILSIKEKVREDYQPGTVVQKITKFHLFETKDQQEHILYIAHSDLFNIKNAASITIVLHFMEKTSTYFNDLNLLWEFWGAAEGVEDPSWHKFKNVKLLQCDEKNDCLDVILTKQKGEIKIKKISQIDSRWIRCKLNQKIPEKTTMQLPVLDNIKIKIKSTEEPIPADQAFNNITPLDISQQFLPFGSEPKIYDQFYIGSKEIFSKKAAQITTHIKLASLGVIGTPAAVFYDNHIIAFARSPEGRLVELSIDPKEKAEKKFAWNNDHGNPPGTKITSDHETSPCAMTSPNGRRMYLFVIAENGHLFERFFNGSQWAWIDLTKPQSIDKLRFSPSVTIYTKENLEVFAIGSKKTDNNDTGLNSSLYSIKLNKNGQRINDWEDLGSPYGIELDSAPFAICQKNNDSEFIRFVFAKGKNGIVYQWQSKDSSWIALKNQIGDQNQIDKTSEPNAISEPYAIIHNKNDGHHIVVFVNDDVGNLWVYADNQWKNYSQPDPNNNVRAKSRPQAILDESNSEALNLKNMRIFIRGSDNCLWEYSEKWKNHEKPPAKSLERDPAIIGYSVVQDDAPTNYISVFSASNQNTILEYRMDISDVGSAETRSGVSAAPDDGNSTVKEYNTVIWLEYKDPLDLDIAPELSWEYWNGRGWVHLHIEEDTTKNFLFNGHIVFFMPKDAEETEVSGQNNYWVRARLVGGDYGRETFALSGSTMNATLLFGSPAFKLLSTKKTIKPPIISKLELSYDLTEGQYPEKCVTYNNLDYKDQSDACKTENDKFAPFTKLGDDNKSVYFGFQNPIEGGPIKIFFAAEERDYEESNLPKFEWSYRHLNQWVPVSADDETDGFIRQGILEVQVPNGFEISHRFGESRYWMRGRMADGKYLELPVLSGIFPNTSWAVQGETISDEIIGSSDGEEGQKFNLSKLAVLENEKIGVRESLSNDEREDIKEKGEDAVRIIKDELGNITETWVLWERRPHFFDSNQDSRHYTLDRATGEIVFGDGKRGYIPPTGTDNIRAISYKAGGGIKGNIKAGDVRTLSTAIAGVESVSNPIAADGGADTAKVDQMLDIGPKMISHRSRAVTIEDFELLAMEASRKVRKVRCLANVNNQGHPARGWVSVYVVPESTEDRPEPSLVLRNKIKRYLMERCDGNMASRKHVWVGGVKFTAVDVKVSVYAKSIETASEAESGVRKKLKDFLHPLTGGPDGKGWEFGRSLAASDIYVLLEKVPGVDHIEDLKFCYDGKTDRRIVPVAPHQMIASGDSHTIDMNIAEHG
jgi:uncharacterized phage protein gp47/JayE